MKTKASKKPQTANKAASLVKKSPVQKSIVKKKQVQNKLKKSKDAEANLSIKEKLSGKIFSPTVEKSKNIQQKKVAQKSAIAKLKPPPGKQKTPPAQTKKKTIKVKLEEKTVLPVLPVKKNSKNAKNNIKKEEEVTSEIKKQPKVIAPKVEKAVNAKKDKVEKTVNAKKNQVEKTVNAKKNQVEKTVDAKKNKVEKTVDAKKIKVEKTVDAKKNKVEKTVDAKKNKVEKTVDAKKNKVEKTVDAKKIKVEKTVDAKKNKVEQTVNTKKDKVEIKAIIGTKRKLKSEMSKLQLKKTKSTEKVKVESGSSPVTSIKDLKPISNIRSLVKRPVKKISKAQIKKKLASFPERGVCYFSHIPHGFYEKELKKYCSQFGEVTGVYHPVSKSGNSRGYAFVEFKHKEVAEVVADAMNNYLMFNRLLKCQYVPPEAQRPWVFKQERNNMKVAALRRRENLNMQMRSLSKEDVKKWKKRRLMKVKSLHKKLSQLGVDYEFQVNDVNENEVQQENKTESDK